MTRSGLATATPGSAGEITSGCLDLDGRRRLRRRLVAVEGRAAEVVGAATRCRSGGAVAAFCVGDRSDLRPRCDDGRSAELVQ
eukprot:6884269-Alexandrium_andersonii.AAC.1